MKPEMVSPISMSQPSNQPAIPAPESIRRATILIAVEDAVVREDVIRLLEAEYRVTVCEGADAVMSEMASARCDLLVMDGRMQTLQTVRAAFGAAQLPIVAVVRAAAASESAALITAGANSVLHHPVEGELLHAHIRQQMSIKQHIDEQQTKIEHMKEIFEKKDRLMHMAAHDLKNPLNTIRIAQHFLRVVLTGESAEVGETLTTIEMTVNTMSELISDILDSATLESGKTQLRLQHIVMEDIIWDVVYRYSATANNKNITLLMGETEGAVMADLHRLTQVLNNLVSNAIKYSPSDHFVTIASVIDGERVRLTVADEGPGVPEGERVTIFEPFGTSKARPTGGESSTGLGLWIVRELVALHHGQVGVECPESGGSIFWVELPLYVEESEAVSG